MFDILKYNKILFKYNKKLSAQIAENGFSFHYLG